MDESTRLLQELVEALDRAFISSWQSTAAWQSQLDAGRAYLENKEVHGTHNRSTPPTQY